MVEQFLQLSLVLFEAFRQHGGGSNWSTDWLRDPVQGLGFRV